MKCELESMGSGVLRDSIADIGVFGISAADDVLLADEASWLAVRAESAVWRTVPVNCSIELALCCTRLAACSILTTV